MNISNARPAPSSPVGRAENDDILDGCIYRWGGLKCPETTKTTNQQTTSKAKQMELIEKLCK